MLWSLGERFRQLANRQERLETRHADHASLVERLAELEDALDRRARGKQKSLQKTATSPTAARYSAVPSRNDSLGRRLGTTVVTFIGRIRGALGLRRGPKVDGRWSVWSLPERFRELSARHDLLEAQQCDYVALSERIAALERALLRLSPGTSSVIGESTSPSSTTAPMPVLSAGIGTNGGPRSPNLLVRSIYNGKDVGERLGNSCYSYHFVYRAFADLLRRWAPVRELSADESAAGAARGSVTAGDTPIHFAFLPLQFVEPVDGIANVAFPFWEFPDIPNRDVATNPRFNWLRVAPQLSLIVTACEFTRDSFRRAGVETPLEVVPVPVADSYFALPAWQPGQSKQITLPCYVLDGHDRAADGNSDAAEPYLFRVREGAELSGIVYFSVLNPFDLRKNWQLMIEAFLAALSDHQDAVLMVKLATGTQLSRQALELVFKNYLSLHAEHRCRIVVVPGYISDEKMRELTAASTYYLNASRAEGACLPLQDALAAGRPGIAPPHTAMAEYFDDLVGLTVASHAEPTHWPFDPDQRPTTTWQRVDRGSLIEAIRNSYDIARSDLGTYHRLSGAAQERMRGICSAEVVWQRLSAALGRLC